MLRYISFDTTIVLDDEEHKVCVEADFEKGYPSTFNPIRECYDESADDEVEILNIYDYDTKKYLDISKLSNKLIEDLELEIIDEFYERY